MTGVTVHLAAEGFIDMACLKRLALEAGFVPGDEFGMRGKQILDRRLSGYNASASRVPWLVARDLDQDEKCPGDLRKRLLGAPASLMCFRIAVRSIEAWLLADTESLAESFSLAPGKMPPQPEELMDPKAALLVLLARSKSREVSGTMVRGDPRHGGALGIGPEYNSRLVEFVLGHWRPSEGARRSASLDRAIVRIAELSQAV